jgi:hypothetical protein
MNETDIRASVMCAARGDATAYYGRFGGIIGPEGMDWLLAAWTVTKRDLKLAPNHAVEFWPEYLKTFEEEAARLSR